MVIGIESEDVMRVADDLNISLTKEQVNKVLHMYAHEEECDPSATWELIVENCIYQIVDEG
jgi:hypothetical protein